MTTAGHPPPPARPRIVVIGGGFGGLWTVRALARADVDVLLIDRRNHHLFQPLLYQVATAALAAPDIAAPLRQILRSQRNVTRAAGRGALDRPGHADGRDARRRPFATTFSSSRPVRRTATSATTIGTRDAPGLKTLDQALEMRRRILAAFENAEREEDPAARADWLRFAIVGGGPTGVELAGSVAEIARHTLRGEFRRIRPEAPRCT